MVSHKNGPGATCCAYNTESAYVYDYVMISDYFQVSPHAMYLHCIVSQLETLAKQIPVELVSLHESPQYILVPFL